MSLCALCEQSISSTVLTGGGDYNTVLHHNHETFMRSVFSSKCYLCSRVWESLNEEQKEKTRRPEFDGIDYKIFLSKTKYFEEDEQEEILADITFEHGEDLWDCEEYDDVGGRRISGAGQFAILNPNVFPPDARILARRTNHPSCWATVARWIEVCSKHENCREPQGSSHWLPTRLVDLIRYDKGRIRVVNSAHLPRRQETSYLALSHCWGRKPFLVMRKENKRKFKKGVSVSSLAPNFRDAMSVARLLGFRYIWIDSLCIIQGSAEDWRREAPTMNRVYRNAFLTIGAMAAPDAHGGLFRDRDPDMVSTCPITISTQDEGVMECLMVKSDIWENNVRQAPLSRRAWVVQERILAPRSLYFCEDQLFWECRELHACESLPDGVPLELIRDIKESKAVDVVPIKAFERAVEKARALDSWASRMADDDYPWVSRQYEDAYQVWNDILESYARCSLTNPSDKFVAISGVAKDFAKIVDDEYLAGLWRRNFINDLLWSAGPKYGYDEDYVPAVRPKVYRAPSWSWASLDAPFLKTTVAQYQLYGEYAEILDVGIELASSDPTGALTHGCVHVSGHLIELQRKPKQDNVGQHFGWFIPDMEDFHGERFFCFPLREMPGGEMSGNRPRIEASLLGLVLTPLPLNEQREVPSCCLCAEKGKFRRVGIFDSTRGDPLRYLSMRKPDDWVEWGEERDHLWFPEDAKVWDFIII